MINGIKSGQNDDWLRKKLLERQSQKAQVNQNIKPQEQIQDANKASTAMPPPKADLPWGNFMNSLGLNPQGSKEADLSAIGEKITQMKIQAKEPTQKAEINSLEQQYNGYKMIAANMQPPAQPPQNQTASAAPEQMTGATQLGEYNKAFIKKRQPE
ncbi:MAG: hypothetical protein WCF95_00455 [bacterium]